VTNERGVRDENGVAEADIRIVVDRVSGQGGNLWPALLGRRQSPRDLVQINGYVRGLRLSVKIYALSQWAECSAYR